MILTKKKKFISTIASALTEIIYRNNINGDVKKQISVIIIAMVGYMIKNNKEFEGIPMQLFDDKNKDIDFIYDQYCRVEESALESSGKMFNRLK